MSAHEMPESRDGDDLSGYVAEEVNALMGRYRVTQTELARVLGIPQNQLSLRLRCKMEFKLHEIRVIAKYFGVDVVDLMPPRGEDDKAPRPKPGGNLRARRDSNSQPSDPESNVTFVDFGRRGIGLLEQYDLAPVLAFPGWRHAAV